MQVNLRNMGVQGGLLGAPSLLGTGGGRAGDPTILRVVVSNVLYPVTMDILIKLFSRFGSILRIVTFTKDNTFQAFLQFADPIFAAVAKNSLDNQNIYNGCNTMKVDYSRLTSVDVKYNNDRSRDFTRPDLPAGDSVDNDIGHAPGILGSGANALGVAGLAGFNFGGNQIGNVGGMNQGDGGGGGSGTPCILVSNLDERKVTPDALFQLFGVYGNVHRVKILFSKKDTALIQMADPSQAQQAITFLDTARLWGKQIRVALSKHQFIRMPKDGQSDAGHTKDYVYSHQHRFKRSGSKNYIFPPTSVLHLYNVATLQEDDIRRLFSRYGTVKGFKFFDNDRKMALIEMDTVEEATLALIGLHNYRVEDNLHMRVSFSRSTI
ncbi:hypothetical protein BsWGS_27218 [Bradybaena similaris]